jgi:hypothetical protein
VGEDEDGKRTWPGIRVRDLAYFFEVPYKYVRYLDKII